MDSLDFETQLVSSMMINGDHPDTHEIIGKLPAEAFENSTLREMYKAISSLIAQCEPTDPFTVRECVPESSATTLSLFLPLAPQQQICAPGPNACASAG